MWKSNVFQWSLSDIRWSLGTLLRRRESFNDPHTSSNAMMVATIKVAQDFIPWTLPVWPVAVFIAKWGANLMRFACGIGEGCGVFVHIVWMQHFPNSDGSDVV